MLKFLRLPLLLTLPLLMTACAPEVSNGVKFTCPPQKAYTKAQDAEVDVEKANATAVGLMWPSYIDDYGQLRAECRSIPK